MTDEERERTMEFILNQQAKFYVDIEILKEAQGKTQRHIDSITEQNERNTVLLAGVTEQVAGVTEQVAGVSQQLAGLLKHSDHLTNLIRIFGDKSTDHDKKFDLLSGQVIENQKSFAILGEQATENQKSFAALKEALSEQAIENQKSFAALKEALSEQSIENQRSVSTLRESLNEQAIENQKSFSVLNANMNNLAESMKSLVEMFRGHITDPNGHKNNDSA